VPSPKPTQILLRTARQLDQRLHRFFSGRSDLFANPLFGDRCIEYAFVIEQLAPLDRNKSVLDVGCCGSPLTTVVKGMGFHTVHGIDLLPSPLDFPGVDFFSGDFLTTTDLCPRYDVVVFCSSIEHFGLAGRYKSKSHSDGDLRALRRAIDLLPAGGVLVLTLPYGVEKTFAPWHRVYNKGSELLKCALANLQLNTEKFFARVASNPWAACTEEQAARVVPTANSYALGMFAFARPEREGT
jgi:SAM-dependent methyltransferase